MVLDLKSSLPDIDVTTPALGLPILWNNFCLHFAFSFCVSLDLKLVSCK